MPFDDIQLSDINTIFGADNFLGIGEDSWSGGVGIDEWGSSPPVSPIHHEPPSPLSPWNQTSVIPWVPSIDWMLGFLDKYPQSDDESYQPSPPPPPPIFSDEFAKEFDPHVVVAVAKATHPKTKDKNSGKHRRGARKEEGKKRERRAGGCGRHRRV